MNDKAKVFLQRLIGYYIQYPEEQISQDLHSVIQRFAFMEVKDSNIKTVIDIRQSWIYPYPDDVNQDRLYCVRCGHSEDHHYGGSYNKEAKRGFLSECGMELQFVCGCPSKEFRYK